jgi:hypothetical protein
MSTNTSDALGIDQFGKGGPPSTFLAELELIFGCQQRANVDESNRITAALVATSDGNVPECLRATGPSFGFGHS